MPGIGGPAVAAPTAPGGAPGGGDKAAERNEKGKNANLGVQRAGFGGGAGGSGRTALTLEDLGMAVGEYGVAVRRGEFYR
jgi:transcription initiation factor TFIID subunit 10